MTSCTKNCCDLTSTDHLNSEIKQKQGTIPLILTPSLWTWSKMTGLHRKYCFSTNQTFLLKVLLTVYFKDMGYYNCSLINKTTSWFFYKTSTNYKLIYYNDMWKIICCILGLSPKWNNWCNVWLRVQYGEYFEHLFQWQWRCSGITFHFICNRENSPSAVT